MSLHGSSSWLEILPRRTGWSLSAGGTQTQRWEGPTATLATFLAGLSAHGLVEYQTDTDGELTTVTVTYATTAAGVAPSSDGKIEDYWELEGNDIEKSLWEHPKVVAVTGSYTTGQLVTLRGQVEDILSGKAGATEPSGADVQEMVKRLARGTEAFSKSAHVLRHTLTVTRASTLYAAHTNVNKRFTYAQITTAEPTLAAAGLIAASGLTALVWLKRTPRVRAVDSGLWELEQEYWGGDDIDTWIYDAMTP
jgi:hypothetical protein